MRVCLFWNHTAGGGASLDELKQAIGRAGHEIVRVVSRPEELSHHHTRDVDCVAAAGGDGTIARAGRLLAGGTIPLAIVPMGTANNIATSLGIVGPLDEIVTRWAARNVAGADMGTVEGTGDDSRHFLEAVGCGLVTDCIDHGRRTLAKDDPDEHLGEARQMYLDRLALLRPSRYTIAMEDETIEGEYLLVEVLNTAQVGPGVELASNVSPSDGLLSVVAVTEDDRSRLIEYLKGLRDERSPEPPFRSWRSCRVQINGAGGVHVDDLVLPKPTGPLDIELKAGYLPILV